MQMTVGTHSINEQLWSTLAKALQSGSLLTTIIACDGYYA